MNIPTTAQLQAAFTAWFNSLTEAPGLKPSQLPNPFLNYNPPLTFAEIQTLLSVCPAATVDYLEYQALLSQSGTSNPTASQLVNTLNGGVTLTRSNVGIYQIHCVGAFTTQKTAIVGSVTYWGNLTAVVVTRVGDDDLSVETFDLSVPDSPVAADGILAQTFVAIKVYN